METPSSKKTPSRSIEHFYNSEKTSVLNNYVRKIFSFFTKFAALDIEVSNIRTPLNRVQTQFQRLDMHRRRHRPSLCISVVKFVAADSAAVE